MIINAEHIDMPTSGEFKAKVFDVECGTSDWTWINFVENSGAEWCGEFRGKYLGVEISSRYGIVAVLTENVCYYMDICTNEIVDYDVSEVARSITQTPVGNVLFNNGHSVKVLKGRKISCTKEIELPIKADSLEFGRYEGTILKLKCEESGVKDKVYELSLDCNTLEIVQTTCREKA